jgi:glycosyltransferase involved in cell wall biosynthesis
MKVSVIVPVYNKAPYLKASFDSIFTQTYADLEVIAVDDRSTDDSLAVLRSMSDPRLKVFPLEKNLGPAGAAQRAMDLAQGEYLVRMDADDIMLPDRVERQVAFLDAHPEVGACGGHQLVFGEENELWRYPIGQDRCRAELLFNLPISQPASVLRRSVLRAHDLRFEDHWPRIGEDWLFWVKMSRYTQFDNVDAPVIRYRKGPQNSMHGRDRASYREPIVREMFRMLDMPLSDEECELHLLTMRTFKRRPDRRLLERYRWWLDELRARNARSGLFPEPAFTERLNKAWTDLFHVLPKYGTAPALAHIRLSDRTDPRHVEYLLKYTVNRWLGRDPDAPAA